MVAFRKLFPVLAIGTFLLGTATTASAQATGDPLVCTTSAGVPPVVRAEGHTELVGDVIVECRGGNPAAPFLANFQLFLNTNITSRLLSSSVSEALLLIDEPGAPRFNAAGGAGTSTPFCVSPSASANPAGVVGPAPDCNPTAPGETNQQNTYTTFRAAPATAANGTANAAVVWAGIPFVPPGSNRSRVVRITNIRANAAGVPASTSLVPTQIFAFLSVSGSQSLALNPQLAVAFVLPGLQFDVRDCANSEGATASFVQCVSEPAVTNGAQLGLRFREGFHTAFKPRILPGQLVSVPGSVFNSESGFVRGDVVGLANVGVADTGTKVAARFTNVPAGVRLFVSTSNVDPDTLTDSPQAYVTTTDGNGAGGTSFTAIDGTSPTGQLDGPATLVCPDDGVSREAIEVSITAGAGLAVWEVVRADPSAIDTLFFMLGVRYTANTPNNLPGLGTASVTGSFAPFYAANSNAGSASTSLPIPRFIDNATPVNIFRIDQCVTNLLFPFVTNQAGFDTGIAISNTSRDPFTGSANRLQAGTCTINYYGSTPSGTAPPADTTNADVPAGGQLTFVLSSGGGLGIDAAPGFQGYIIAQCRFQFAHGFAFVTDGPIGQARVAEGYLALVMDEAIGSRTGSLSEVLGH